MAHRDQTRVAVYVISRNRLNLFTSRQISAISLRLKIIMHYPLFLPLGKQTSNRSPASIPNAPKPALPPIIQPRPNPIPHQPHLTKGKYQNPLGHRQKLIDLPRNPHLPQNSPIRIPRRHPISTRRPHIFPPASTCTPSTNGSAPYANNLLPPNNLPPLPSKTSNA